MLHRSRLAGAWEHRQLEKAPVQEAGLYWRTGFGQRHPEQGKVRIYRNLRRAQELAPVEVIAWGTSIIVIGITLMMLWGMMPGH